MPPSTSIVRRVATGSALAASAAALLAPFATTPLSSYLTRLAEDRRLIDAAVTFAAEIDRDGKGLAEIRQVHRDESEEMHHTGMLFAVFDAEGHLVVGDRRAVLPA